MLTPNINTFWIYPFSVDFKFFERFFLELKKELNDRFKVEIEIYFTDDLYIELLNKRFLDLAGPTNVLSFPDEDKSGCGSVVISLETVFRESILYGQNLLKHLVRVMTHGVLHILGYEHSEIMFDLEEKLAEKFASDLYNRG